MGKFWIEDVKDVGGNKYWVLFTHGEFHMPVAMIDDLAMKAMARKVLSYELGLKGPARIGGVIVAYRREHKMYQQEFADACGISRTRISQIENGNDNITQATYMKIMGVIGE